MFPQIVIFTSCLSDDREGGNTKSFSHSFVTNLININLLSSSVLCSTVVWEGLDIKVSTYVIFQKETDCINSRALKYSLQTLKTQSIVSGVITKQLLAGMPVKTTQAPQLVTILAAVSSNFLLSESQIVLSSGVLILSVERQITLRMLIILHILHVLQHWMNLITQHYP